MARPLRLVSRRSLLASAAGLAALGVAARPAIPVRADEPEPAPVVGLLDGVPLSAEDAWRNDLLPVAVMIDNLPEARPQCGLDLADLVYELLVEGGITRFMAVYLRNECEYIEPVRSARTPFLPLARELGAILGHVGAAGTAGSTDAQSQFGEWGVLHLDEQFNPDPFWRDPTRYAPHNAVTSTVELRGHALGLGWQGPSHVQPWTFKEDFEPANPTLGTVDSVSYAFAWAQPPLRAFAAAWTYDPSANAYVRWMAGSPHRDGVTGAPLVFKNVVAQFDDAWTVNREGHVLYGGIGAGPAYVFLDGQMLDATWTKPAREERTRYWDASGDEIRFNRGATWVSMLPYGSPLGWE